MRKGRHWLCMVFGVALAVGQAPIAAAGDSPRLKYRSKGSPCACASGMSEADISRAMAGLDRLQSAEPQPGPGDTKDSEADKRRNADEELK